MGSGHQADAIITGFEGLDALIALLRASGYATRGPVIRHEAIVHGELRDAGDLPIGCHDRQAPGSYRLEQGDDDEVFGWAVGPQSLKGELFPASATVWRASGSEDGPQHLAATEPDSTRTAFVGARPCELAAASVLGRVLSGGSHPDLDYTTRRLAAFVVVAECSKPSGTCFCTAMGGGPGVELGFDLAISELGDEGDEGAAKDGESAAASPLPRRRYLLRAGSEAGRAVIDQLPGTAVGAADWAARESLLAGAVEAMRGRFDATDVPALLARNLGHPRWSEVAERCLACGNCTMVCPTCFCSDIHDVTDLAGGIERTRRWSSCFELSHSHLHGGAVRPSTASRYRQWATHKLSTWHDQFGTSGCVGCGRCIAWCPVGIDITEEVQAIRERDGEVLPSGTRTAGLS